MENNNLWHYKNPNHEQLQVALKRLNLNMRKIFIQELVKLNSKKKKIYLVINDLGFNVIEPFKKNFLKQFFNAGVSEQSMMGLSAGIASEKCHTFVYSIANFTTLDVQNK